MSNQSDNNDLEWIDVSQAVNKTITNSSELNDNAQVQGSQLQMIEDYIDINHDGLNANQSSLAEDAEKILIPNDNGIVIKITNKNNTINIIEENGDSNNEREERADKMLEELFKPSDLSKLLDSMYDNQIFLPPLNILDSDDEHDDDKEGKDDEQNLSNNSTIARVHDDELIRNCLLQFKKASSDKQSVTTTTQPSSTSSANNTNTVSLVTSPCTDTSRNAAIATADTQVTINYINPWSEESNIEAFIHNFTTNMNLIITTIITKMKPILSKLSFQLNNFNFNFILNLKFPDLTSFTFSTNVLACWSLCNTLFGVVILIFLFTSSRNTTSNTYSAFQPTVLPSTSTSTATMANDFSLNAVANTTTSTTKTMPAMHIDNQTKTKTIIKQQPSNRHFSIFNNNNNNVKKKSLQSSNTNTNNYNSGISTTNEVDIDNNDKSSIQQHNNHNHNNNNTENTHNPDTVTDATFTSNTGTANGEAKDEDYNTTTVNVDSENDEMVDEVTATGAMYEVIQNFQYYHKRLFKRLFYDIYSSSSTASSFFIQQVLEKKLSQLSDNIISATTASTTANTYVDKEKNNASNKNSKDDIDNSNNNNNNNNSNIFHDSLEVLSSKSKLLLKTSNAYLKEFILNTGSKQQDEQHNDNHVKSTINTAENTDTKVTPNINNVNDNDNDGDKMMYYKIATASIRTQFNQIIEQYHQQCNYTAQTSKVSNNQNLDNDATTAKEDVYDNDKSMNDNKSKIANNNGFCKNKVNNKSSSANEGNNKNNNNADNNNNNNNNNNPFHTLKQLLKPYTRHIKKSVKQAVTQHLHIIQDTFQKHIIQPLSILITTTQSALQTTLNVDLLIIDMISNVFYYMDNFQTSLENNTMTAFANTYSLFTTAFYSNNTNTNNTTGRNDYNNNNGDDNNINNDITVTDLIDSMIEMVDNTEQWLATTAATVTQKSEGIFEEITTSIQQALVLGISLDLY